MYRVLLLALLASAALPATAQHCDTALAEASEQYRTGYFDAVIDRLSDCLDRNAFSVEERRRAYRLLGLSYIGKDREQDARDAVRALLEVAPDYQPDPVVDPPPFVRMVEEMNHPTPRRPGRADTASPIVSTTRGFMGALNLTGTGYADSDDDSASGAGLALTLGYGITPTIAAYLRLTGATFSDFSGLGSATTGSVGVGGRYHFGGGRQRFVPFLGAGVSYQALSLDFDDYNGAGGAFEVGLLYFVNPAFAVGGGVQALFSSLTSDQADRTISASTVSLGFGVSWSPSP